MYATKYIVPFISLKGTSYKVEIQTEGYTGTAKELVGSVTPFTVKLDDNDFLYSPCRFSTASLSLVGDDYLQELFSTNYQQYRIVLKSGTNVVWVGFVSPEIYTQDYANIPFELEVQCSSAMSTLEYLDYKKVGEACTFVSIFDVLKQCVKSANADYSNIFVPHVYASSEAAYTANENVFEKMTISEQNFFDEDGKALKLKEVLEEICKFLGWTCVDAFGSLYFVDVDYSGDYLAYSGDFSSVATRSFAAMNVQQIGFAGGDQTLDILGGYSKASVKVSNYNLNEAIPKEDFDTAIHIDGKIETRLADEVSVKKLFHSKVYNLTHYKEGKEVINTSNLSVVELNNLLGATLIKADTYNMTAPDGGGGITPDITDYSWEEAIQVRLIDAAGKDNWNKVVSFANKLPTAVYTGGAINISGSVKLSVDSDLGYYSKAVTGLTQYNYKQNGIPCKLSVGSYSFDSELGEWVDEQTMNDVHGREAILYLTFKGDDFANFYAGKFTPWDGNRKLDDGYTGAKGLIVPLPSTPLTGELYFCMFPLNTTWIGNGIQKPFGYFIKDLEVKYIKTEFESSKKKNEDRVYENVVNDKYINECDSIELKINSYNNDDISFSKVLLSGKYLTDNLYCKIANKLIRPEEQLIRRIINQYSATKIKLKQVLIYSDAITPVTRLSDNYTVNRVYMVSGGEIDFAAAKFDINMIEIK